VPKSREFDTARNPSDDVSGSPGTTYVGGTRVLRATYANAPRDVVICHGRRSNPQQEEFP
jgi:hypothetical protein